MGIPSRDYTNKQKRDYTHAPGTHLQASECSALLGSSLSPTITTQSGRLVGTSLWVQEGGKDGREKQLRDEGRRERERARGRRERGRERNRKGGSRMEEDGRKEEGGEAG